MATEPSGSTSSIDPIEWNELVSDERRRLLLTIGHLRGPKVFERPELKQDAPSSSTLADVIDDVAGVVKTLKDTGLLNGLVEDGYLRKTFQGGKKPIVLDLEYDEDRDTREVAPFGATAKLRDIVSQVLDREGLSESALGSVDMTDFNAVITAVNRTVGKTTLVVVSDPSKYRLREEAVPTVMEKVKEASD